MYMITPFLELELALTNLEVLHIMFPLMTTSNTWNSYIIGPCMSVLLKNAL